jgi:hypothetical protein
MNHPFSCSASIWLDDPYNAPVLLNVPYPDVSHSIIFIVIDA